jgi:hypothetical protein
MARDRIHERAVVSATMNPVAEKTRISGLVGALVVGQGACCLGSKYVYHTDLARFSVCHFAFRLCSFLKIL